MDMFVLLLTVASSFIIRGIVKNIALLYQIITKDEVLERRRRRRQYFIMVF